MTEKDPDYVRKSGAAWAFPQHARQLIKTLAADLIGLNALKLLKSKSMHVQSREVEPSHQWTWVRPAYYGAWIALAIATNTWHLLLAYWVLPLLTVLQVLVRFAALCEHKYNLVNATVVESTPLIKQRWWEAIFFPSLNFHAFHIYHHWYPAVPCSKLPQVHEIFRREGLVHEDRIFQGYTQYLRQLLK
jgi:fatty acid desaturase